MKYNPSIDFARNLTWLLRHLNGETLTEIGLDVGHKRGTISKHIAKAAEALVEQAQATLMQEVFPLAAELWRESIKAEIAKAKKGEKVDFALIDRLFKGMSILDRAPQPTQLPITPQIGEGVETLAGYFVQRPVPPRIADRIDADTIDVQPVPEVEEESQK